MLRKLGVDRAAALVVTMDSPQTAEHVVATARQHWPELLIYARARDRAHAARLVNRGASHVIPETVEASLQMGEMVLMGVGVPDEAARRIIEARRQAEQVTVNKSR
jgi:CPA2 family monovalent cation:H+ antiporter-2